MILPLLIFPLILIITSPLMSSPANASCTRVCGGGGRETTVQYPFGFTSDCEIRLNCSEDGNIQLGGGYNVQNLTRDHIPINFPAKCDRRLEEIRFFSGPNFALTSRNGLLLENCHLSLNDCVVSPSIVENHFNLQQCNSSANRSMNCYSQDNPDREKFLNLIRLEYADCKVLFSSVIVDLNGTSSESSAVSSLDVQWLQLGWWVNGDCKCHRNAVCRNVSSENTMMGYRCHCNTGYDGDGFIDGDGCHRVVYNGASNMTIKLIIGLSCTTFGIILVCVVIYFGRKRSWQTRKPANHKIEMFIKDYGTLAPKRYKYSEIKKMQNSFQEELGRGGYGSVYKGLLPDGKLVAVKLLDGALEDGEDFINEVASISKTSHVNIVSLLGFCIEGKQRALIYEFMPNGSLDRFLRGDNSRLDWNTLFLIAKGIARGLEYLHRGCSTRIVHFDIKPHNILLDEEFVPKISDFGLAKLCKKKESVVSVMGARGTVGYMAPEVHFRSLGGASHKSDVYSYGMMVLEMTGARKNNNANAASTSEAYFPEWIYKKVETGDNLGVYGVTTEDEDKLARKMVTVSLWCIQYGPSDRPSISKVVEMLEGSLESLQVPPRRFWSSPTRLVQGTSSLGTQSSTSII